MPGKALQNDSSGMCASKAAVAGIPKSAHDKLFFSTTSSSDWNAKVVSEADQTKSMKSVYDTGTRGCQVPLLTYSSCSYRRDFSKKEPDDLDFNRYTLASLKAAGAGGRAPKVGFPSTSAYAADFGHILSPEARRCAKPQAVNLDAAHCAWGGGKSLVSKSTSHAEHGLQVQTASLARSVPWVPADHLEVFERSSDFWRTRYQAEHTKEAAGLLRPLVQGVTRARQRRGKVPENVETLLGGMAERSQGTRSTPTMIVPISFVGCKLS